MKHHVIPLLRKEPSFIIIHSGADDASYLTSRKILDNLITLKSFATDKLPNCKFVISTPTLRTDDGKAALKVSHLTNHFLQLDIGIIDNRNINARNLGNIAWHLNLTANNAHLMPTSIHNSQDQFEKRNLKIRNFKALANVRLQNQNRPVIGQLNINSIRNKFYFLCSKISLSIDLLHVSEKKFDDSFRTAEFLMSRFCKPYRLNRC